MASTGFADEACRVSPEVAASGARLVSTIRKDWQRVRPLVGWVATHAPPT